MADSSFRQFCYFRHRLVFNRQGNGVVRRNLGAINSILSRCPQSRQMSTLDLQSIILLIGMGVFALVFAGGILFVSRFEQPPKSKD